MNSPMTKPNKRAKSVEAWAVITNENQYIATDTYSPIQIYRTKERAIDLRKSCGRGCKVVRVLLTIPTAKASRKRKPCTK